MLFSLLPLSFAFLTSATVPHLSLLLSLLPPYPFLFRVVIVEGMASVGSRSLCSSAFRRLAFTCIALACSAFYRLDALREGSVPESWTQLVGAYVTLGDYIY